MLINFLKPRKLEQASKKLLPIFCLLSFIFLACGYYVALFASPPDYQQGEAVRIKYVHVPSAWMCLLIFTIMAISSLSFLIWKTILADVVARAIAPIGAVFAFITLATGMFWGKPIWGVFWAFDARLTFTLVLFLMYIGYIALNNYFDEKAKAAKALAFFTIMGFVNVPIIRYSVEFLNSLHQKASISIFSSPAIHKSMAVPLYLVFTGFIFFSLIVAFLRILTELKERRGR